MKKIINGKVYNTESAEFIASHQTAGRQLGIDFDAVYEALYKTKRGAYFLVGEGFNMPWGKSDGNGFCYGENIVALTEQETLEWCEKRQIDPDDIEGEFQVEEA